MSAFIRTQALANASRSVGERNFAFFRIAIFRNLLVGVPNGHGIVTYAQTGASVNGANKEFGAIGLSGRWEGSLDVRCAAPYRKPHPADCQLGVKSALDARSIRELWAGAV